MRKVAVRQIKPEAPHDPKPEAALENDRGLSHDSVIGNSSELYVALCVTLTTHSTYTFLSKTVRSADVLWSQCFTLKCCWPEQWLY